MKIFIAILLSFVTATVTFCQDNVWSLERCLEYAENHNLNLKNTEIAIRLSKLEELKAKTAYIPSINGGINYGMNFGRSINPTTNQFDNTQFNYSGFNVNSSVLLFGWFKKKHDVNKAKLNTQLEEAEQSSLSYNLKLNIIAAYLSALLAQESIAITKAKIELDHKNISSITQKLDYGKSNALELAQAKLQLHRDSLSMINATKSYDNAILNLKTLLNIDYSTPTRLMPFSKAIEEDFHKNNFQDFEMKFIDNHPTIIKNEIRLSIAQINLKIARTSNLPQINLFTSIGSNYSSLFFETLMSGERRLMPLGKQLNNNLSNSIGLSLNIPIFNGFNTKISTKSAKEEINRIKLDDELDRQKIRQEYLQHKIDYNSIVDKINISQNLLTQSIITLEASRLRYDLQLLSFLDLSKAEHEYFLEQMNYQQLLYEFYFKGKLMNALMDNE